MAETVGSDQTAALFLFWGPKDWLQMGVLADGRYVIDETRKGNLFEWCTPTAATPGLVATPPSS